MQTLQAAILGFTQGITEFLPVSSSAHLVMFQNLFGFKSPELAFDIALHYGTLLAAVIYFRGDLWAILKEVPGYFDVRAWKNQFTASEEFRLGIWVIVATIPTALIGVLFKDRFEEMFGSFRDTSFQLVLNAGILWLAVIPKKYQNFSNRNLDLKSALLIGIAQGIAIVPGISRSGITIVTALLLGIHPKESVRFSFLLSIVAIFAAGVLEFRHGLPASSFSFVQISIGTLVSFLVGYWSIAFLLRKVESGKMYQFANYCLIVGIAGLVLHYGFRV